MSAPIETKNIFPVVETDEFYAEGIFNSPRDFFAGE